MHSQPNRKSRLRSRKWFSSMYDQIPCAWDEASCP
jgi:hypothetical protein